MKYIIKLKKTGKILSRNKLTLFLNSIFNKQCSFQLEPSLAELETIGLLDNPLAHINVRF
jgi:hypothetical protein